MFLCWGGSKLLACTEQSGHTCWPAVPRPQALLSLSKVFWFVYYSVITLVINPVDRYKIFSIYVCMYCFNFCLESFFFKKKKCGLTYFFHLKTFSSKNLTHYKYILQVLGRKFWIQCPPNTRWHGMLVKLVIVAEHINTGTIFPFRDSSSKRGNEAKILHIW